MRQVLRFEGPDGRGPACGGHRPSKGGYSKFFSTYLYKMKNAYAIPGFKRGEHYCAIAPSHYLLKQMCSRLRKSLPLAFVLKSI